MRIALLLSASRHPLTGRPALADTEARALGLALSLAGEVTGFHAGPKPAAASIAFGHGLTDLRHLRIAPGEDPLPPLAEALAEERPDLILAGRRAEGGEESGLLPYLIARRLGAEIVADAVSLREASQGLMVEQGLAKGTRRTLVAPPGSIVTVHPGAPAPAPFAFAQAKRGRIETRDVNGMALARLFAERPLRRRGRALVNAAGGEGERLVDPAPDDAARAILAHLERLGILR